MVCLLSGTAVCRAQHPQILSPTHAMLRLDVSARYLLLPVEERQPNVRMRVVADNAEVQALNVRMAVDTVDYYVPLDIRRFGVSSLLLDITFPDNRPVGAPKVDDAVCWRRMHQSDSFDTRNSERLRPLYHHTPPYGWMNDPNGMFYKDGTWHLCYQWNPYGSTWENMTWGHSLSPDLFRWESQTPVIEPDGLGVIYSGSAAVVGEGMTGEQPGHVVAIYTSRGTSQTQSVAVSSDGGKTFRKEPSNPVLTGDVRDFRDPKIFWNDEVGKWNLVLAAGNEVRFYSSSNLREWTFESAFGKDFGSHAGVWECPDLVRLPVRGSDMQRWLLIVNIGSGGPSGGSATQYFTGMFDGHEFRCESAPDKVKWMDYGRDHYATVTFSGCPQGRHVALAWMSNWQYANQVPTQQFRSANSLPRDLDLFIYEGETYCGVKPSPEVFALRGSQPAQKPSEACEIVLQVRKDFQLTLSNSCGERVVMSYDKGKQTLTMDRTQSGNVGFSPQFPCMTEAPTFGALHTLHIFIDRCSIEVFDAEGHMAMTNLVFPSEPYTELALSKGVRCTVYPLQMKP